MRSQYIQTEEELSIVESKLFSKLEKHVVGNLSTYHQDNLYGNDKKRLQGYYGRFLHTTEDKSTSLMLFDFHSIFPTAKKEFLDKDNVALSKEFIQIFLLGADKNKRVYSDGENVVEINQKELIELYGQYMKECDLIIEELRGLDIIGLATRLNEYIYKDGGYNWRKKIVTDHWDNMYGDKVLRKLKTHFTLTVEDLEYINKSHRIKIQKFLIDKVLESRNERLGGFIPSIEEELMKKNKNTNKAKKKPNKLRP